MEPKTIMVCRVICDALGILQEDSSQEASSSDHPAFRRDIIIEAEMVAYSEVLHRIDGKVLRLLSYLFCLTRVSPRILADPQLDCKYSDRCSPQDASS